MKTNLIFALMLSVTVTYAQQKQIAAVLNIDSRGIAYDSRSMAYMVRLELEKTNYYSVLDKYEIAEILSKNKISTDSCYSKSCLVETGRLLGVDKVISGSIEKFDEKIVLSLRLIDIKAGVIEKNETTEYLNLPEVQKMVEISVKKLLGTEVDKAMAELLIDYNIPITSPRNTLRLNGPRMGCSYMSGSMAERLTSDEAGGFNMSPVTFNFGWHHEKQYISAGNFQAVVENIFLVSGLESGKFIPSYTPMMGFRFGKKAWEFGFGPTFRLVRKESGYYDSDNKWHIMSEWVKNDSNNFNPNPGYYDSDGNYVRYKIRHEIDSRGLPTLSTGLVFAIGRTFHSGYLNIPVNIYITPRRDGTTTVGFMFGFNIQKKSKSIKVE